MSGFREMVKQDIHRVFLNTGEFAENRTVKYDGDVYTDIPIVLEGPVEEKRDRLTDDHILGLHKVTAVLFCARSDLGGKLPKQGSTLEIARSEKGKSFQKYYIAASTCDMGMLYVELEAIGQ